jgi:hypothetical protein
MNTGKLIQKYIQVPTSIRNNLFKKAPFLSEIMENNILQSEEELIVANNELGLRIF